MLPTKADFRHGPCEWKEARASNGYRFPDLSGARCWTFPVPPTATNTAAMQCLKEQKPHPTVLTTLELWWGSYSTAKDSHVASRTQLFITELLAGLGISTRLPFWNRNFRNMHATEHLNETLHLVIVMYEGNTVPKEIDTMPSGGRHHSFPRPNNKLPPAISLISLCCIQDMFGAPVIKTVFCIHITFLYLSCWEQFLVLWNTRIVTQSCSSTTIP